MFRSSRAEINPWILMGVFCVLLGPFVLDFHMHYPDEMYYRDAAVEMLRNGDYLNTYLGNGELRFKKPILTYWAVLAGFKLFGLNEFASRIFFLLSGAATVGLTFLIARILFEDRRIAGLSALVMAANIVLILSSGRSIPDVLLVLTMTIAALGFAGLLRDGDQASQKYLWLMYIGLALAFEVKGLPAVALGVLGLAVLLFNPWKRVSVKKLFHIPSILVSLTIALFWYGIMWKMHGMEFINGFLEDQVGIRVASRFALILKNGFLALGMLLLMFVPWIIMIIPGVRSAIKKAWSDNPQFFLFVIVWGLGILGMSALTSKFYERYLLPVAPVMAVWIGWIGVYGRLTERKGLIKGFLAFFLFLNLVLSGASLWINSGERGMFLLLLQGILGILFIFYTVSVWMRSPERLIEYIPVAVLMCFFLISSVTYHISLPHQGEQAARLIKSENIKKPIGFYGSFRDASKIRMSLGTDYEFVNLPQDNWQTKLPEYDHIILEDKYLLSVDTSQYEMKLAARSWDSGAITDLLRSYHKSEFDSLLEKNSDKYYLLIKR